MHYISPIKTLLNILKITLPLIFGVFVIWYVYDLLGPEEKKDLFKAVKEANYFWITLSMLIGIGSHISRAYRWKYLLEPLGHQPKFLNSFFSVMIAYIINLILPRVGEISRCAAMAKYENKLTFQQYVGTLIAERLFDLLILGSLIAIVIVSQYDVLADSIDALLNNQTSSNSNVIVYVLIALMVFGFIGLIFIYKSNHKLAEKIRGIITGLLEGVKTIFQLKKKGAFLFHTFLIWFLYFTMAFVAFQSIEETAVTPIMGVLASFVYGGLSIIFVQGGIGVYPAAIMQSLMLYGIDKASGLALGWIFWGSQTIMLLILGSISLIAIPIYNKRINATHES